MMRIVIHVMIPMPIHNLKKKKKRGMNDGGERETHSLHVFVINKLELLEYYILDVK